MSLGGGIEEFRMNRIQGAMLVLALFLPLTASGAPDRPPVEIVSAEFGIFDASNPRELVFEPTSVVPHRTGQRYGWIIEVRTKKRSLSVREEYLIPLDPARKTGTDSSGRSIEIPLERRNQVSQRQLVPVDGKIIGEWAVGPEEPAGRRHLQVVIEGVEAAGFEYEVREVGKR